MKITQLHFKFRKWPATSALGALLCLGYGGCAYAQSAPTQAPAQDQTSARPADDRNNDRREELNQFEHFLDDHREIAEQLRRDPSLADNQQFLKDHPALQTYLQDHPGIRQQFKDDPNAFMRQEDQRDRMADNREMDRRELASFNEFLENHRETAEQLRKDPSLVDNREFLKDHPALESYLRDHPGVRDQLKQNPDQFMREEARYEHRDDFDHQNDRDRDYRDEGHSRVASFGQFLGTHENIAEQLTKDPALVKNQEYLQDHPELQDYLKMHPEVRHDLMSDPQAFVKSAQQFNADSQAIKTPMSPTADQPKPKP
jgi:hypothetical protein